MQQFLVVRLPPVASYGVPEESTIHAIVEGPEDPIQALLDGDEITAGSGCLMQLKHVPEPTSLRVFVPSAESTVGRIQLLGDEAQHSRAKPRVCIASDRCRDRRGD